MVGCVCCRLIVLFYSQLLLDVCLRVFSLDCFACFWFVGDLVILFVMFALILTFALV